MARTQRGHWGGEDSCQSSIHPSIPSSAQCVFTGFFCATESQRETRRVPALARTPAEGRPECRKGQRAAGWLVGCLVGQPSGELASKQTSLGAWWEGCPGLCGEESRAGGWCGQGRRTGDRLGRQTGPVLMRPGEQRSFPQVTGVLVVFKQGCDVIRAGILKGFKGF